MTRSPPLVPPIGPRRDIAAGPDPRGRTREGRGAELRRWFDTPIARSDRPRDELAIKLAMAVTAPGVDVRDVVQTQRTATMRMLQDLTRLKAAAPAVPDDPAERAWRLVLESMLFHAEAEVRWLDHCEAFMVGAEDHSARDGVPGVTAHTGTHPPRVADRLTFSTGMVLALDRTAHRTTEGEERRIDERLADVAAGPDLYVERGLTEPFGTVLLLLGATAAVLVLGGSLIATGLSAADSRPDLATLAAVGAAPRTRRWLTMGQAGCVAVLGTWLGIASGMVPGIAAAVPLTRTTGSDIDDSVVPLHGAVIDIPWQLLIGVGVCVPLAAMLVAGLFTGSRLTMARRVAA